MRIELYGRNAGMKDVENTLKTSHSSNVWFTCKMTAQQKYKSGRLWLLQYFSVAALSVARWPHR